MTTPALDVRGLTKVYGSGHTAVTAVDDATFSLGEHEFIALVGPSGSGKTTLLSMVGGLLTPTEGSVDVGGVDLSSLSSRDLTKFRATSVGFVFQAFNLVPFLTARENMTMMASIAGIDRGTVEDRADELLSELGLSERAKNLPEELSGGERQRVAIGRALVTDPQLILVDEPTASLDSERGAQVVEMLAEEIKGRGKAGIMVTHDLRMVDYTDRAISISDGALIDAAPASLAP
jgi:putative ABC transport system ATP-binding protein